MRPYKNIDGDSGVQAFEYGTDFIKVKFFNTEVVYVYTNASAGTQNIAEMKRLADDGRGLNAFINLHVKTLFARKEL
jgi:hypothetical protein